ncbi:MAG: hypothetical protein HYY67_06790 [Thaumarchaeota archaeon]|nr:hypothetical protein [Nitrososphaerota archaeon]
MAAQDTSTPSYRSLLNEYKQMVESIASAFSSSEKPSPARIMSLLSSHSCDLYVKHALATKSDYSNNKSDNYFLEKHEYALRKLVERLKTELLKHGMSFHVYTEADSEVGHFDVLIKTNGSTVELEMPKGRVVIEMKTGFSINLSQLERYLLDTPTLILCRILPGHVMCIRAEDYSELLTESLADQLDKADRILEGQPILVPGTDCYGCKADCPYAKPPRWEDHRIVLRNDNFSADMDVYFKNLYPCIKTTVDLALQELNVHKGGFEVDG